MVTLSIAFVIVGAIFALFSPAIIAAIASIIPHVFTPVIRTTATNKLANTGEVAIGVGIITGSSWILWYTIRRQTHNQLAVLSCGVHKERAVEYYRTHRRDGGVGVPRVAPLADEEAA